MTAFELYGMSVVPELVAKVHTLRAGFDALARQSWLDPDNLELEVDTLRAWSRWQDALTLARSAFDDLYYPVGARQPELLS